MYAILYWVYDNYITFIHNENGSIKLFQTLKSADNYANKSKVDDSDNLRVISVAGVDE